MIDFEALFKISYGLYVVSSGNKDQGSAYIANTFSQMTSEPPQFAIFCSKNNYTTELIKASGVYAVSVLAQDAPPEIIGRFGFRSGRDFDKLEGMNLTFGTTGCPIVLNNAIAFMECKVINTIDVGTHMMFIGQLLKSELLDGEAEPLTYAYYRNIRKGFAPKNAPTYIDKSKFEKKISGNFGKYECTACGYIFNEETGDPDNHIKAGTTFGELPAGWTCPICGAEKEDFILL
ncbi:flavin reductase [Bacteroidota bacterium]